MYPNDVVCARNIDAHFTCYRTQSVRSLHGEPGPPSTQKKTSRIVAHKAFQVGLTDGHTAEEWLDEIETAQAAGIDGFALNIGPSDPWTSKQLGLAYAAAAAASGGPGSFVLFLSFDMAAGEWSVPQVISLINDFKDAPAQCKVDDGLLPLVSTFEGPAWADRWATVREATGGIFLVPDWSSLGPWGVGHKLDLIDGAFSWCAWPRAGQRQLTTEEDVAYRQVLGSRAYMMGVSPWFYTSEFLRLEGSPTATRRTNPVSQSPGLPQWSKNWHSSGESLWYDRWKQIWELEPRFVQIITCEYIITFLTTSKPRYTLCKGVIESYLFCMD